MSRKKNIPGAPSPKGASDREGQATAGASATAKGAGPSPAGANTPKRPAQPPPKQDPPGQPPPGQPPPGLDDARHAASQRAAHHAEALRAGVFPGLMASALAFDKLGVDGHACKIYLQQLFEDAGSPTDPIERMLVEQLGLAHFRIAQLHSDAGQSKGAAAAKIYNAAAARMLGEFRRTALALRAYRGRVPEGKAANELKIFRAAQ